MKYPSFHSSGHREAHPNEIVSYDYIQRVTFQENLIDNPCGTEQPEELHGVFCMGLDRQLSPVWFLFRAETKQELDQIFECTTFEEFIREMKKHRAYVGDPGAHFFVHSIKRTPATTDLYLRFYHVTHITESRDLHIRFDIGNKCSVEFSSFNNLLENWAPIYHTHLFSFVEPLCLMASLIVSPMTLFLLGRCLWSYGSTPLAFGFCALECGIVFMHAIFKWIQPLISPYLRTTEPTDFGNGRTFTTWKDTGDYFGHGFTLPIDMEFPPILEEYTQVATTVRELKRQVDTLSYELRRRKIQPSSTRDTKTQMTDAVGPKGPPSRRRSASGGSYHMAKDDCVLISKSVPNPSSYTFNNRVLDCDKKMTPLDLGISKNGRKEE